MAGPGDRLRRLSRAELAAAVAGAGAAPDLGGLRPPVVVGCSGGADSLALLAVAVAAGLDATAVHVDHGSRPGSAAEAGVVAGAAAAAGAGFAAETVAVAPGASFEARARDARYGALERARSRLGATITLVGHTRDDQAETVLLNLLRGGASAGLAGIPPSRRATPVYRPLLGQSRGDTRRICHLLGWSPLEDPMNADLAHRRVWLRREVLPALVAGAGRDVGALLARQAALARDESDYLDSLAAAALAEAGDPPETAVLARLPVALLRRALRLWFGPPPPDAGAVESLVAVVTGGRRAADLVGNVRVVRERGRLAVIRRPEQARREPPGPAPLSLPGRTTALGLDIEAWVERAAPTRWPDGRWVAVCDADAAGDEAVLRRPRPAERFRPLGLDGTKLLSDALAEAGVAAEHRRDHPVLATPGGEVLWLLGYRIDDRVRVRHDTRRFLWLTVADEGAGGSRV